ncbi:inhibitory synaptic factor 1 [Taeniopygia guttata]|uniref:Inhibitory synaptic factor 1 n=1 Tax=Taeniopygia guttata TaxID=59729 RepID=A0A674GZ72_TAEGU|nr:inhibitory synaptic factor 1 [Taeniopygia guttata]
MDSRSRRDAQPARGTASTGTSTGTGTGTAAAPCGAEGERERIRGRMRMVIGQLEGILRELKEVAKELREVVSQIDRLTSDFALDLEPDAWTPATASSTSSSDRGGASLELGPLDFAASDVLSDSWEFCSFLDASTPSDPGDCPEPPRPPPARLMNGGVPVANGPRGGGGTPDSSSEECFGSAAVPKIPAQRPAGTRERVRFSDKVLYHALCCDDDGDADDGGDIPDDPAGKGPREQLLRKPGVIPIRRATRNSSTQTVADKSTQTLLPYVPARQRIPNKN